MEDGGAVLDLALAFVPDVDDSHQHGDDQGTRHTLDEDAVRAETNDKAFDAAQRAYIDDDDDDEGQAEGEQIDAVVATALVVDDGDDDDNSALLPPVDDNDNDEDLQQRSGGVRGWLAAAWHRASSCPWKRKSYIKLAAVAAVAAVVIGLFVTFSDGGRRQMFQQWVNELGWWGNLVFVLAMVFANLPFGFGFIALVATCGTLYPPALAAATVAAGLALGLSCCHWTVRLLLRRQLEKSIAKSRKLQVLVFAARSNGAKLSCLIRFIPATIGIQTGVLAIADIPYLVAVPCSFLALTPELASILYVAYEARQGIEEDHFDALHIAIYVLSAVLLVAAIVFLGHLGKQALQQASDDMERQQGVIETELHQLPHQDNIDDDTSQ